MHLTHTGCALLSSDSSQDVLYSLLSLSSHGWSHPSWLEPSLLIPHGFILPTPSHLPQDHRVVSYSLFYAPVSSLRSGFSLQQAPPRPLQKLPSSGVISGLTAGTNYSVVVRARTVDGWGPSSEPLLVRTMHSSDLSLPLPPPTVEERRGCDTVMLRLPVLTHCSSPPPHWDVEWAQGAGEDWHVMQPRTVGGRVLAVGLDPYAIGGRCISSR